MRCVLLILFWNRNTSLVNDSGVIFIDPPKLNFRFPNNEVPVSFCFLFFAFFVLIFFFFLVFGFFFWVKHCLRIGKKYRVHNTTLMTWKHFSHVKSRVKLLREIFAWKIFFPCSVETTKEGYCLRYREAVSTGKFNGFLFFPCFRKYPKGFRSSQW